MYIQNVLYHDTGGVKNQIDYHFNFHTTPQIYVYFMHHLWTSFTHLISKSDFFYSPCTLHVHVTQSLCKSPISNLCFMHENLLSLDNCISWLKAHLFTQTYPNNSTLNIQNSIIYTRRIVDINNMDCFCCIWFHGPPSHNIMTFKFQHIYVDI